MSQDRYKNRKYTVVLYNPQWQQEFIAHAHVVRGVFGDAAFAVEHIGSTAVSGMAGKPTLDILVVVKDIGIVDEATLAMEAAGYKALGEYVMQGARLFVQEEDNVRLCNVHVFEQQHPHVHEILKLRDYLRSNPDVVREYSELKMQLFQKYPDDYGTYRKYKDEYMEKFIKDRGLVSI